MTISIWTKLAQKRSLTYLFNEVWWRFYAEKSKDQLFNYLNELRLQFHSRLQTYPVIVRETGFMALHLTMSQQLTRGRGY